MENKKNLLIEFLEFYTNLWKEERNVSNTEMVEMFMEHQSKNLKQAEAAAVCQCECPTGREVDENFHQICTTCGKPTSVR